MKKGECQNPFCLLSNNLPVTIVPLKSFFGVGMGDMHCADSCAQGPIDLRIIFKENTMPLSVQGNEVLTKMWDQYRIAYVAQNPGCNMNDVERDFLYHIFGSLVDGSDVFAVYSGELQEAEDLIEKIR